MLTGTDVLNLISWVYWGAAALALLVAVVLPKTPKRKAICASVVVGLFSILPLYARLGLHERNKQVAQEREKLNVAMARFEERCKTAGEKIYRTVEDVEGIVWMKWRLPNPSSEQFVLNDPYGSNCSGLTCISTLLLDERMIEFEPNRWRSSGERLYSYVDSVEPGSSEYSRYAKAALRDELKRSALSGPVSRYGVTWEDISTVDDRALWIAGGRMQILDLSTNEVLAERIGYLIDQGQGSTHGFRSPWSDAFSKNTACPSVREHNVSFITKVLKPKKQGK